MCCISVYQIQISLLDSFQFFRMLYDSKDLYEKLQYNTIYAMSLGTINTYFLISCLDLKFAYAYRRGHV